MHTVCSIVNGLLKRIFFHVYTLHIANNRTCPITKFNIVIIRHYIKSLFPVYNLFLVSTDPSDKPVIRDRREQSILLFQMCLFVNPHIFFNTKWPGIRLCEWPVERYAATPLGKQGHVRKGAAIEVTSLPKHSHWTYLALNNGYRDW